MRTLIPPNSGELCSRPASTDLPCLSSNSKRLDWSFQRTLSKINYRIHTDAIKKALIPPAVTKEQIVAIYATETDILNVALFGSTAKQWREYNPGKQGNIRDEATLEQLVVLSNLESINSLLIHQGHSQTERLKKLNEAAIQQMKSLKEDYAS